MDDFHCSFCGKRRMEVRKLISGPRVFICNECVECCRQVLGPRLNYLHRYADVSMTRQEHDRRRQAGVVQTSLQFGPAEARHSHVEEDTRASRIGSRLR